MSKSTPPKPRQTAELVFVTKEQAKQFLAVNHEHQRNKIIRALENWGDDMTNGRWITTHEGIAFDEDGRLIDGQHRLTSLAESGLDGLWFWVFRGLPREAMKVINRGRVRNTVQALACMGFAHANHDTVAVAKAMLAGPSPSWSGAVINDSRVQEFIVSHIAAIEWAQAHVSKSAGTAILRAVVARGCYAHCTRERLARFCAALSQTLPAEQMDATDIGVMRFALSSESFRRGGGAMRLSLYRRWQNVLWNYLQFKPMQKVYESEKDLLPMPEGEPIIFPFDAPNEEQP